MIVTITSKMDEPRKEEFILHIKDDDGKIVGYAWGPTIKDLRSRFDSILHIDHWGVGWYKLRGVSGFFEVAPVYTANMPTIFSGRLTATVHDLRKPSEDFIQLETWDQDWQVTEKASKWLRMTEGTPFPPTHRALHGFYRTMVLGLVRPNLTR